MAQSVPGGLVGGRQSPPTYKRALAACLFVSSVATRPVRPASAEIVCPIPRLEPSHSGRVRQLVAGPHEPTVSLHERSKIILNCIENALITDLY